MARASASCRFSLSCEPMPRIDSSHLLSVTHKRKKFFPRPRLTPRLSIMKPLNTLAFFTRPSAVAIKLVLVLLSHGALVPTLHAEQRLRLATTTSTENSGLLAAIHPSFEKATGTHVDVIAVGSGRALELADNGDVDVVLVHDPDAEADFIASGAGIDRRAVMYNDFVIVGPAADPAAVGTTNNAVQAFATIARHTQGFVSRGDKSGTHTKELALWQAAHITPGSPWYFSAGQAMGPVLLMSSDKQAYTLTDRGTWIAYRKKLALKIVYEGDTILSNLYHVIRVNPQRHAHVQAALALAYADFLVSAEGQALIASFKIEHEQLFVPNALAR